MQSKLFLFVALVALLFTSCEKSHTTAIHTHGIVENQDGDLLQGIVIITEIEGFERIDTTYTSETGEFFSTVKKIPYPIPTITITAIDPLGVYQMQSMTPHYMYECGTDFVPENNCAYAVDENDFFGIITFILTRK